jgi:hypothetical protein
MTTAACGRLAAGRGVERRRQLRAGVVQLPALQQPVEEGLELHPDVALPLGAAQRAPADATWRPTAQDGGGFGEVHGDSVD